MTTEKSCNHTFAAEKQERSLPPGWDETHLEAYRDGYTDALIWAYEHDHDEIEAVLDAE